MVQLSFLSISAEEMTKYKWLPKKEKEKNQNQNPKKLFSLEGCAHFWRNVGNASFCTISPHWISLLEEVLNFCSDFFVVDTAVFKKPVHHAVYASMTLALLSKYFMWKF